MKNGTTGSKNTPKAMHAVVGVYGPRGARWFGAVAFDDGGVRLCSCNRELGHSNVPMARDCAYGMLAERACLAPEPPAA